MSEDRPARIAKVLARAGLCSRRDAERWVAEGRVAVDGQVLTSPAVTVTAESDVRVDGERLPAIDRPGLWRVGVRWTSSAGQYPARWGFFQDSSRELQPGEEVTVRGGIQLIAPQPPELDFWATVEMGGLGFTGDYGQTHVIVGH